MKEKVRMPIIWFSLFMALMLFQTSYMRLGTITAFFTLSMSVLSAFACKDTTLSHFRFPLISKCILLFITLTVCITLASGNLPNYFVRFVAQIILFLVLATLTLNFKETKYLRNVFIFAAFVYAILTINSCIKAGSARYVHSAILLFNTKIDPNFIGIPFVAASAFVLDGLLTKNKKILNLFVYTVIVVAIVYTASKSNFLCLLISNLLVIYSFIYKHNIKLGVRLISLIVILFIIFYGMNFLSVKYSDQWARMIGFSQNSDNGRIILWERAVSVFYESPLFGKGLGYMTLTYGKATHNTYLQLLCETGLFGCGLFAVVCFTLIRKLYSFDKTYLIIFITILIQITFLDALDNRCLWIVLCWFNILPIFRRS